MPAVAEGIVDQSNFLDAVYWELREKLQVLAKDYHRQTGNFLKLRSGVRTCAQQNALYAQGPAVTKARGCQSWHVVGRAVDLDPVTPQGTYRPDADYRALGASWKLMGGYWGGDITGLYDAGHFQWSPGLTIQGMCPNPDACTEYPIQTKSPWPKFYMIAGGIVLTAGVSTWLLMRR